MFRQENARLVDELETSGVHAQSFTGGMFEANYLDKEKYSLVGRITGLNTNLIDSVIRNRVVPVVASLAETSSGQLLNINADTAACTIIFNLKLLNE